MDEEDVRESLINVFQGVLGAMAASAGIGGSDLSLCTEGDWRGLAEAGPIFRAVRRLDTMEVERLLKQDEYIRHVDDLDGDGAGALHVLALDHKAEEWEAADIVDAFKNTGRADLNRRGSGMMSAETPLHAAACHGNYAVIKALIDAGATVDISDDFGRTPLSRAEDTVKKPVVNEGKARKSLEIIRESLQKQKDNDPSPNKKDATAQERRAEELTKSGNQYYWEKEWSKAADMYQRSSMCHEDHRSYGGIAASSLQDAVDRISNGKSGYRGLFKQTFMMASQAVEMEPKYEKGWYRMARGYLGFRELPRAKKAAKDGLEHCPGSSHLSEIWAVLDHMGVPDQVADHDSEEWKEIYERIYDEHWIGPVQCKFCELKCMTSPPPDHCPFCICPTALEMSDDDEDMIICLVVSGNDSMDDVRDDCLCEMMKPFSLGAGGAASSKNKSNNKKKGKKKGRR